MSTDVWITLITAVVAPVALKIVAHFFPPAGTPSPAGLDPEPEPGGVYDVDDPDET